MCVLSTSIFSSLFHFSMCNCLVIFQSVVLDTLSVHFRCKILRRHLLMKVCISFGVFCVLIHRFTCILMTINVYIVCILLIAK